MRGCALRIGGLTPLSTVDYPGQLACVMFCQGCPWRCSYCHNPHLIPANIAGSIDWQTAEDFLQSRRGLLDAVVFSGGEPTAQPAIVAAAACARDMQFKVGVHTGGAYPERLSLLLPLCDWIALDIKTTEQRYEQLTGSTASAQQVWRSLDALLRSNVSFEVRTTVSWQLLSRVELLQIAQRLQQRGVQRYAVQYCRPVGETFGAFSSDDVDFIQQEIAPRFAQFELRGAHFSPR